MTETISEYAFQRDLQEFSLGDTLDIKTGLILAALTFLAIQSGEFIKPGLTTAQAALQTLSITCLVISGVFVVCELKPRDYDREPSPDAYLSWIEQLKASGVDAAEIPQRIAAHRLRLANQRVTTNAAINVAKAKWMNLAFWFSIASFALNVITLTMRLF